MFTWNDKRYDRHDERRPRRHRHHYGRLPQRHRAPRHTPPDDSIMQEQTNMNTVLQNLFSEGGQNQDFAQLKVDGRRGPATNGTEAALNDFFNTMLPENMRQGTLAERAARFNQMIEASRAPGADPAMVAQFNDRLTQARTTLRDRIAGIGTPPNGFDRQFGPAQQAPQLAPTQQAPAPTQQAPAEVNPHGLAPRALTVDDGRVDFGTPTGAATTGPVLAPRVVRP